MAKSNLRIVALDETHFWSDEIRAKVGRIWGLYLYDANRQVHCCELTPSYELFAIRSAVGGEISEETEEDIMEADRISGEQCIYTRCSAIDKLPADRFITDVWSPEEYDTDEEYMSLIDDVLEHYNGNHRDPACVRFA